MAAWSLEPVAETATLLLSEVVTNAVLHSSSQPTVRLAVAGGALEIGVDDDEPRLPNRRMATSRGPAGTDVLLADGGRGLLLIDALADEWGATALAAGKQVWFRLDIGDWPYRSACVCAHHDGGDITLGSGLHAHHMPGPWPPLATSQPTLDP
jgi:hypothetical protein